LEVVILVADEVVSEDDCFEPVGWLSEDVVPVADEPGTEV
jgi:hypothetical protein